MAVSTWSHGTPTSLGIKRVTYITLYQLISHQSLLRLWFSQHSNWISWKNNKPLVALKNTNGWNLTKQSCSKRALQVFPSVGCLPWCTVPERARRPQRESSRPWWSVFPVPEFSLHWVEVSAVWVYIAKCVKRRNLMVMPCAPMWLAWQLYLSHQQDLAAWVPHGLLGILIEKNDMRLFFH